MHRCFIAILFTLSHITAYSQSVAMPLRHDGESLDRTAMQWIGSPYLRFPLEKGDDRSVLLRHDGFDCTTLVETALADWLAEKHSKPVTELIRELRYRNGVMSGYGSRLHYTTEWARQACRNHFLINITASLGGKAERKKISFISKNTDKYPKLKALQALDTIRKAEISLSNTEWPVLPKLQMEKVGHQIVPGDIIAFVSALPNLDIAHIGIATAGPEGIHLLHASPKSKKVEITQESLLAYLRKKRQFSGIMVFRPIDQTELDR